MKFMLLHPGLTSIDTVPTFTVIAAVSVLVTGTIAMTLCTVLAISPHAEDAWLTPLCFLSQYLRFEMLIPFKGTHCDVDISLRSEELLGMSFAHVIPFDPARLHSAYLLIRCIHRVWRECGIG
jgi:hypothetical protein